MTSSSSLADDLALDPLLAPTTTPMPPDRLLLASPAAGAAATALRWYRWRGLQFWLVYLASGESGSHSRRWLRGLKNFVLDLWDRT